MRVETDAPAACARRAPSATNPALSASRRFITRNPTRLAPRQPPRRCGPWAVTGVAPVATHRDRAFVLQAVDDHAEVPETSRGARTIAAWDSSSDSHHLVAAALKLVWNHFDRHVAT